MSTEVLGKLSFSEVPDVNGLNVLLNAGGVPNILSNITANRPAASVPGRLFIDTTLNLLQRDTGSAWVDVGSSIIYTGAANQISVAGSIISIATNPILPGTGRFRPPVGTTAQRQASPAAGDQRFNTTLGWTEEYNGSYWGPMGRVIQVVSGNLVTGSTTATIPYNNNAPTTSNGAEVFSQTFTPLSATSRVIIQWTATVASSSTSGNNSIITSTFADSTNIGSTITRITTTNRGFAIANTIVHTPGSLATITYSMRFGGQNGTHYINTDINGTLGGTTSTQYVITEVA